MIHNTSVTQPCQAGNFKYFQLQSVLQQVWQKFKRKDAVQRKIAI